MRSAGGRARDSRSRTRRRPIARAESRGPRLGPADSRRRGARNDAILSTDSAAEVKRNRAGAMAPRGLAAREDARFRSTSPSRARSPTSGKWMGRKPTPRRSRVAERARAHRASPEPRCDRHRARTAPLERTRDEVLAGPVDASRISAERTTRALEDGLAGRPRNRSRPKVPRAGRDELHREQDRPRDGEEGAGAAGRVGDSVLARRLVARGYGGAGTERAAGGGERRRGRGGASDRTDSGMRPGRPPRRGCDRARLG